MNEPIQHAQGHTGKVLARDVLRVLRGAYSAILIGVACHDRESYSDAFTFVLRSTFRDGSRITRSLGGQTWEEPTETHREISLPGYVTNGHTDATKEHASSSGSTWIAYCEPFRPKSGSWWIFGCTDALIDALELLPRDAEVGFHVYLDAGTNEVTVRAALHVDRLYLCAWYVRGKRRVERRILIDATTGRHNSARFGWEPR